MKKAIFLVIVSLTLQGFSQVESGVYKVQETYRFIFEEGVEIENTFASTKPMFLHISNNGFRVYTKNTDTGNSYPLIYIGTMDDGFESYAVPFGDRFEMKDDFAVLFQGFDNSTGWYTESIEWRGLEYISNVPILDYEEEKE